jgi:hypothetical protein
MVVVVVEDGFAGGVIVAVALDMAGLLVLLRVAPLNEASRPVRE